MRWKRDRRSGRRPDERLDVGLAVPPGQLLAFLIVAAIGGGIAGAFPAPRASQLDVLAAISSE